MNEFAPASLHLRELPPKRVRGEPERRWFWSARCDLIVWLADDGTPDGFQFCYDKDFIEHALTWMPGYGFSHMRVDSGGSPETGEGKGTPLLVLDGAFDAARMLEIFTRESEFVPGEYVGLVVEKLAKLAASALP